MTVDGTPVRLASSNESSPLPPAMSSTPVPLPRTSRPKVSISHRLVGETTERTHVRALASLTQANDDDDDEHDDHDDHDVLTK